MRARGANATLAIGFEASEGVPPADGFYKIPFVSANLGEEQGLEASDIMGHGRLPQEPGRGAVDDAGDVVVPLCARNIGIHLFGLFGEPTTTEGVAASGALTFSAQPANNATITIGGQAFTFVTGTPTTHQIKIGATLPETIANATRALNASVVAGVAAATYRADVRGAIIRITHDTLGTSGNSFTLVAGSSPASNAVASAATLTGGAATGAFHHTFVAGAQSLPSASIEVGLTDVNRFGMNWGGKHNSFGVQLARSGNLNATLNIIAQGETVAGSTGAGTPTELAVKRFSNFSGLVLRNKVPIADLVAGALSYMNGLDPVPAIGRGDGRISGVDEGVAACTGTSGVRYSTNELQLLAENGEASEFEYAWTIPGTNFALRWIIHAVHLPKAKLPVTGPTGIQADYAWQGSEAAAGGFVTVVLTNDVEGY